MTDIELLIDLHKDAERQGPGSPSQTKQALGLIDFDKSKKLKIADIGCGNGAQTIILARNTKSQIVAIDQSQFFLDELIKKSQNLNLNNIVTLCASMDNLPFENLEFDIIWSEGAIYNIGFEHGIKYWRKFLKVGGYLAVSELSWTTDLRPGALEAYWNREYPQIDTASNKIRKLEESGYALVGYFLLPEYCWTENYYHPLELRFEAFLKKHQDSNAAKKIVELQKEEIKVYRKYKDYYSYGFYVAKKSS